mmetsp:Transcript_40865/g.98553  ORF Transcript_40865/g.98553 Transcript_40865/m.98553 type:complete len:211 (-) Transcript_40865:1691-2323(-)
MRALTQASVSGPQRNASTDDFIETGTPSSKVGTFGRRQLRRPPASTFDVQTHASSSSSTFGHPAVLEFAASPLLLEGAIGVSLKNATALIGESKCCASNSNCHPRALNPASNSLATCSYRSLDRGRMTNRSYSASHPTTINTAGVLLSSFMSHRMAKRKTHMKHIDKVRAPTDSLHVVRLTRLAANRNAALRVSSNSTLARGSGTLCWTS